MSVVEQPREGTLAWLQLQEHVEVDGLLLPRCHRVPGKLAEPDGRCRVIKQSGERCGSVPTRLYGICITHLGGGEQNGARLSRIGNQAKLRLKTQRQLLGISANRTGSARQMARLEAQQRAADVAAALLAPLDDSDLGSLSRQAAAVKILDATEPIQTASVEVELPADETGVQGLGWAEMQQLAAKLLG